MAGIYLSYLIGETQWRPVRARAYIYNVQAGAARLGRAALQNQLLELARSPDWLVCRYMIYHTHRPPSPTRSPHGLQRVSRERRGILATSKTSVLTSGNVKNRENCLSGGVSSATHVADTIALTKKPDTCAPRFSQRPRGGVVGAATVGQGAQAFASDDCFWGELSELVSTSHPQPSLSPRCRRG